MASNHSLNWIFDASFKLSHSIGWKTNGEKQIPVQSSHTFYTIFNSGMRQISKEKTLNSNIYSTSLAGIGWMEQNLENVWK